MPTKVTLEQMDHSTEKLIEMATTWANFNGFSGEICGDCKSKANVLAGGPGWFCPCGHYNVQAIHGCNIPHQAPDYGPPHDRLLSAFARAREQKEK